MKSTLLKLISAASITATFSILGSLPASAQAKESASGYFTIFSASGETSTSSLT